ncbi:MAG: LPS export ABC transporter periplasmic protein LptC [Hyphomonadaceae bacterium]
MSSAAFADPRQPVLGWEPRRELSLQQARRRTRLIRVWRAFCIGVCIAMGLLVVGSGVYNSIGQRLGMAAAPPVADSVRMINPRFTGRTANGVTYVLTAKSATRRGTGAAVDLEAPSYRNGQGRTMTAPRGVYDPDRALLDLLGGVVLFDNGGNSFRTAKMAVNTATGTASGGGAVQGGGPMGSVSAGDYELDGEKGVIRMSGGVKGMLQCAKP